MTADDDDGNDDDNHDMKNVAPGPANEEVLLQWLMQCREPSVQHLTDSTFEHLTQVIFPDDVDDDVHDDINLRPQLEQPLVIGLSFSSLTSARRAGSYQSYILCPVLFSPNSFLSGEWRRVLTALPAN